MTTVSRNTEGVEGGGRDGPAVPQQVQDVVPERVSVLLQHPPDIVHHLDTPAGGSTVSSIYLPPYLPTGGQKNPRMVLD